MKSCGLLLMNMSYRAYKFKCNLEINWHKNANLFSISAASYYKNQCLRVFKRIYSNETKFSKKGKSPKKA